MRRKGIHSFSFSCVHINMLGKHIWSNSAWEFFPWVSFYISAFSFLLCLDTRRKKLQQQYVKESSCVVKSRVCKYSFRQKAWLKYNSCYHVKVKSITKKKNAFCIRGRWEQGLLCMKQKEKDIDVFHQTQQQQLTTYYLLQLRIKILIQLLYFRSKQLNLSKNGSKKYVDRH